MADETNVEPTPAVDPSGRIRTAVSPATWTADEQAGQQPEPQPAEAEQPPIDLRPPKTPEPEKAPPPPPPPAEQPAKKK